MSEQPYVTTAEAAKRLHLSPRTLERRRSRGDGPRFRKAGKRVLYRIDEIETWLAANSFGSSARALVATISSPGARKKEIESEGCK